MKHLKSKISVIVSCFNQPNAMRLVLEGLLCQSNQEFELVVADDGSDPDSRELVEGFRKRAPFPVIWCTQRNQGFRKSAALNRGIRSSRGDYCLFLDGDCVPARDWIVRHMSALMSGIDFCVAGYVHLPFDETRDLSTERVRSGDLVQLASFRQRCTFAAQNIKQGLYIRLGAAGRPYLLGGNWAVRRAALERINGFDEGYANMGREDSDIRNRLVNAGYRARSLWNSNWVYHCDHRLDPRRNEPTHIRGPADRDYYQRRKRSVLCPRGLRFMAATRNVKRDRARREFQRPERASMLG